MGEIYEINALKNNTIQYLHAIREEIDFDPIYQRQGDVWSRSKQQLLIDSILNDFDVPKIYFHQYQIPPMASNGVRVQYALVDGKQRLQAIFGFIDGKFALADDFVLFGDGVAPAIAGLTYRELKEQHPRLALTFDSTSLDVVVIKTTEIEYIEEMFSRLNEAVPLNAPEKRNAFGGPCRDAVRELIRREFFTSNLPFTNNRYRHQDLAAKFLLWEFANHDSTRMQVRDVKKARLDHFFVDMRENQASSRIIPDLILRAGHRLDELRDIFTADDPLLQSVGSVSIFYLLHLKRSYEGRAFPSRSNIKRFEDDRRTKYPADTSDELAAGVFVMLEYNRLSQSPNDGSALQARLAVIDAYITALETGGDPLDAVVTSSYSEVL